MANSHSHNLDLSTPASELLEELECPPRSVAEAELALERARRDLDDAKMAVRVAAGRASHKYGSGVGEDERQQFEDAMRRLTAAEVGLLVMKAVTVEHEVQG